MPAVPPASEPLRCTINEDLYEWLGGLSSQLYVSNAVLVRMFVMQLKEGEPATLAHLETFMRIGLCEAVVRPQVLKVHLEPSLVSWFKGYVRDLRHPAYPKRMIRVGHLVGGYFRFVQTHEGDCVRYGTVRLQSPGGYLDAPRMLG